MSRFERWWISSNPPSKVWSQTPGVGVLGALSQPQGLWPPFITAITIFLRVLFPNSQSLMTPALAIVSNSLVELPCVLSLLIGLRLVQLALQAKAENSHQGRNQTLTVTAEKRREQGEGHDPPSSSSLSTARAPKGRGCSLKKKVWNRCF